MPRSPPIPPLPSPTHASAFANASAATTTATTCASIYFFPAATRRPIILPTVKSTRQSHSLSNGKLDKGHTFCPNCSRLPQLPLKRAKQIGSFISLFSHVRLLLSPSYMHLAMAYSVVLAYSVEVHTCQNCLPETVSLDCFYLCNPDCVTVRTPTTLSSRYPLLLIGRASEVTSTRQNSRLQLAHLPKSSRQRCY